MIKLHLVGKPATEGARRLAWHIGRAHRGDVAAFAADCGVSPMNIDRLLTGEIVPGTDLALRVGLGSDGYVSRRDFQIRALAGWLSRPSDRPSLAERWAA